MVRYLNILLNVKSFYYFCSIETVHDYLERLYTTEQREKNPFRGINFVFVAFVRQSLCQEYFTGFI